MELHTVCVLLLLAVFVGATPDRYYIKKHKSYPVKGQGYLRDRLGSYDLAFYLAGIPPLIGGAMLCLIPWVEQRKRRNKTDDSTAQSMITRPLAHSDVEKNDKLSADA